MSHCTVPAAIFRAYDIRGLVGRDLTEDTVFKIGCAIGSEACRRQIRSIVIGRDARSSSPALSIALSQGLQSTGMEVVDVGCLPTPALYFAAHQLAAGSGVMVTGSHNPIDYNGLKIVLAGDTLCGEAIQSLYQSTISGDYHQGTGRLTQAEIIDTYSHELVENIQLMRPFKVVVDCGNGVAGLVVPRVLKALGCEVYELFCELESDFPNHHPDPSQPDNLQDLIQTVKQQQADIGLAFDGDGDR
ncbi:MAG: phosphomannomutase/phosphoglucomutase, partial [Gammaproteobacteria bacterium]|nr:phosphomannomutase/phosphoglucomutase [Gammaproteobacteria bacterium]